MSPHRFYFRGAVVPGSIAGLLLTLFLQVPTTSAIPSYARQTGFPCKSCHMTPPELTALGRTFKLNGYTMAGKPTVTSKGTGTEGALNILESFPLSVLFDTAYTSVRTPEPGTQNGSFQFPEDASLFLAGAWSTHVGSFVQVTYNAQTDHFSWDNSDIRYANATKLFGRDMVYGITFNNNPSVEDIWNSTPAWGYPWVGSNWAPTPAARAIVDQSLAQDSAGLGAYTMIANHFYLDASIYRSAHLGTSLPYSGTNAFNLRGVAPYWRAAWQQTMKNNYLEIGTFGMYTKTDPGSGTAPLITGPEDIYTDWGVDFQDDVTIPQLRSNVLSFRGTYIRQNSSLHATSGINSISPILRPHLNTVRANAEYHFGDRVSATFGWFNLSGTTVPAIFAPSPITGSANGDPHSTGYIGNLSWWPVQNISLTFQYTGYLRFNGGTTNYDGLGRSAGQNSTAYLLVRFVF